MSGPKYSEVFLERRRLLMLKAQLEAEIEKQKCAQIISNINASIENCNELISTIDTDKYCKLIQTADSIVKNKTVINEIRKLIEEMQCLFTQSCSLNGNSDELIKKLSSCDKKKIKIKNIDAQIKHLLKKLNIQYNEQQQTNREIEFENTTWDSSIEIINISQTLLQAYNDVIEKLLGCSDFENEKAKYDSILNNHSFDDNYKIAQIKRYYDAYLVEQQSDSDNEEIIKYRNDFIVLSSQLYGSCAQIPNDLDDLKEAISVMIEELQQKKVGEYIADSVNRVMTDLGYSMLSHEILEEQKMDKQHFDYSTTSAVTVASSDTGSMMLEVVGKKVDNADGNVAAVKNDMEHFCPDYAKVKKGLEDYGITLTDKKLCQPDEKYVRFVDISSNTGRRITSKSRKKRMLNE